MMNAVVMLMSVASPAFDHARKWIDGIPFEAWPQQPPLLLRGVPELRPAMVNDLAWFGFGARTQGLVDGIVRHRFSGRAARNRMLSVVMPGHHIDEHADGRAEGWLTRVHVPLATNPEASFTAGSVRYVMQAGVAYAVDITQIHFVENAGATPRVHLMFDVFA